MPSGISPSVVRVLGGLVETIHAVVYFAPEPKANYEALGLRGYWRGYFASRAAPLGTATPELVTALFGGFAPAMVARAIPEVWTVADPATVSQARLAGAVSALDRVLDDATAVLVAQAATLTRRCVEALQVAGRPMAAAQSGLTRPAEPTAALWHDCTVLREHRGDGHLAAIAVAGFEWPEPHLLQGSRVDPQLREYRGWDEQTWNAAGARVRGRDLRWVEAATDRLAASAYAALEAAELSELARLLTPLAEAASHDVPYPNAMGLPEPSRLLAGGELDLDHDRPT